MSKSPKAAIPTAVMAIPMAAVLWHRAGGGRQNPYGASRFDNDRRAKRRRILLQHLFDAGLAAGSSEPHRGDRPQLGFTLRPPGRAHRLWRDDSGYGAGRGSVKGRTIDGELVAKSVADTPSPFSVGDRVFHQKFGNGNISAIEGNKLTIDFDKAGQKRVLDGFVAAV